MSWLFQVDEGKKTKVPLICWGTPANYRGGGRRPEPGDRWPPPDARWPPPGARMRSPWPPRSRPTSRSGRLDPDRDLPIPGYRCGEEASSWRPTWRRGERKRLVASARPGTTRQGGEEVGPAQQGEGGRRPAPSAWKGACSWCSGAVGRGGGRWPAAGAAGRGEGRRPAWRHRGARCGWISVRVEGRWGKGFPFSETRGESRLSKRSVGVDFSAMATPERKGIIDMFGKFISLISLISQVKRSETGPQVG
jgi:hypothetical protein